MFKATKWISLVVHCVVYTISVTTVVFLGYGLMSIGAILLLFHKDMFLDRRTFVSWWVKHMMKAKGSESKWLCIMANQICHIIILGAVVHIWF